MPETILVGYSGCILHSRINVIGLYVETKSSVNGNVVYKHLDKSYFLWSKWMTTDRDGCSWWFIGPENEIGGDIAFCFSNSKQNSNTSPVGSSNWQERMPDTCGDMAWRYSRIEVLAVCNQHLKSSASDSNYLTRLTRYGSNTYELEKLKNSINKLELQVLDCCTDLK
jgi:hypothetical protein